MKPPENTAFTDYAPKPRLLPLKQSVAFRVNFRLPAAKAWLPSHAFPRVLAQHAVKPLALRPGRPPRKAPRLTSSGSPRRLAKFLRRPRLVVRHSRRGESIIRTGRRRREFSLRSPSPRPNPYRFHRPTLAQIFT